MKIIKFINNKNINGFYNYKIYVHLMQSGRYSNFSNNLLMSFPPSFKTFLFKYGFIRKGEISKKIFNDMDTYIKDMKSIMIFQLGMYYGLNREMFIGGLITDYARKRMPLILKELDKNENN